MKMTDALRAQILSLHAGGAPRRMIRQMTGATHWQVGAVINAREAEEAQQQQQQPAAAGLCGIGMLCGAWIAPDETASGYPGDQPADQQHEEEAE